jgi:hypothetical protein
MWIAVWTGRCLVDTAAQIGEGLRTVGRWVLLDAANFKAENLRDARPNQIGENHEASVVDAVDKEAHTLGTDHWRMPRSMLVIECGKLERTSRGARGVSWCAGRLLIGADG